MSYNKKDNVLSSSIVLLVIMKYEWRYIIRIRIVFVFIGIIIY